MARQGHDHRRRYVRPQQRLRGTPMAFGPRPTPLYGGTPQLSLRVRRRPLPLGALALIVAVAAVLTAATLGIVALASAPKLVAASQVLFDGRAIGVVADESQATDALSALTDDLRTTYGMDIAALPPLTFQKVRCDPQLVCSAEQIARAIKANLDVKVLSAVVVVNDRPAVALQTQAEAQQVLDTVLAFYQDAPASRNRTGIGFVENVTVRQMPMDYSLVCNVETAVRTLSLGADVEDNIVEAQKGDSLARIAKREGLKVSDLRRANPGLAGTDIIQPGDRINAVKPTMWVNVRFTETVSRKESLPFETVEQPDDTLYTSQKSVKQEGKKGTREVVARVTYISGMEAGKEILSETVTEPAQDRIVLRGTKKVPTNLDGGTGGTTAGSGFSLPLTSYRLTSTFKKRTLMGVTRWHYGIDMAAPTGTPIYASKAGTVSFSGSASGYGLLVKLNHGGGVETRYGHCSKLLVKKGQQVKKGQIIALVGSTGRSTGPHLHFEIRINGKAVNPENYVKVKR